MHELPQNNIVYPECYNCSKTAGWTAVSANLFLAVFKAVVGFISGSRAVLADSLYSFKDFLTSLVVFIGVQVSGKPADEGHPYGHGKIEYVSIFLISILIIIGTLFLLIHSVKDIWHAYLGQVYRPKLIALFAAIISMIANYKLSSYLYCVGEKLKSPAVVANAKHNHSDAVSSAFVAGAVLLSRYGFYFVDPLVAVIETLDLIRLSAGMLNDSFKGIMDSSLPKNVLKEMEMTAMLVPGVKRVARVNARKVGHGIWVDMIIKVDQSHTLDKGYVIGAQVENTLKSKIGNISGINMGIEAF
ncbi:MAG: magnetosome biogenesis CDF transporter MamM [Nitrospirae bacterium]|nr:magnetosome biogenesis CDF transporter MamM [Nitrospirota bacterium]